MDFLACFFSAVWLSPPSSSPFLLRHYLLLSPSSFTGLLNSFSRILHSCDVGEFEHVQGIWRPLDAGLLGLFTASVPLILKP